jgi:hypothetical protein
MDQEPGLISLTPGNFYARTWITYLEPRMQRLRDWYQQEWEIMFLEQILANY